MSSPAQRGQGDVTIIDRDTETVREDAEEWDVEMLRPLFREFGRRGEVIWSDNSRELINDE